MIVGRSRPSAVRISVGQVTGGADLDCRDPIGIRQFLEVRIADEVDRVVSVLALPLLRFLDRRVVLSLKITIGRPIRPGSRPPVRPLILETAIADDETTRRPVVRSWRRSRRANRSRASHSRSGK